MQAAADAAQVPLRVTPEPPDVEVVCDARQLRSAVVNMLDNAIKYSGPDAPVEIGACISAERIAISVRDRGIGIPTRDLERIFERFYRVDRARSRETGGTGLGLSIVRHVAQAHGGEVAVDSIEGQGSTFSFILPLAEGTAGPGPGTPGNAGSVNGIGTTAANGATNGALTTSPSGIEDS